MRILLPPSEAKRPGGRGRSLQAKAVTGPWVSARQPLLTALALLCQTPAAAIAALQLPRSVAQTYLDTNSAVAVAATMPALDRYSGVLYSGLEAGSLTSDERRIALKSVLIFSGLFGALHGAEAVPDYRVPAKAVLPGVGVAGSYWKSELARLLPSRLGAGVIIDLRSSDYQGMWQPASTGPHARRLVRVRVLSKKPDGSLGVISYASKLQKGRLAAQLVRRVAAGEQIAGAADVAETWKSIGGREVASAADALVLIE